MTRKLPWARSSSAIESKPLFKSSATPTPGPASRSSPQIARGRTPQVTPRRGTPASVGQRYQPGRSPSTSPPPQPLPERFMIEGRDADDMYRMVEDEFVVVAGQFTAHLHRAEYERLKNQTRSQNAVAIESIARPVVGSLTEIARKRQETVLRRRQQTEALRKAKSNVGQDDLSGDEGDAPWKGTALHGLMETRTYDQVPLTRLVQPDAGPTGTRRSATASAESSPSSRITRPSSSGSMFSRFGLKRLREEEIETESDDEDDLDAGVVNRPRSLTTGTTAKRPSLATPTTQPAAKYSTSAPQQKHPASKLLPAAQISRTTAASSTSSYLDRYRPGVTSTPLKAPVTKKPVTVLSDSDEDPFASIIKKRQKTRTPETASTPTRAPVKTKVVTKVPDVSLTIKDSSDSETDLFADFMKSRRKNSRPPRRTSQPEEKKPERKKSLRELIAMHH